MRRTQKPASHEQLAGNRANAAQSSGPEAPGAVKHSVTASTFVVARLEFHFVSAYQPVNSQDLFARRATRLESGFFTTSLNETLDANDRPFTPMSEELAGNGAIEITRARGDFNRHDLPNEDLPNEDLPNEPNSGFQAQHKSATYPSPETNPSSPENVPSASDADPFAGVPRRCQSPRKKSLFRRAIRSRLHPPPGFCGGRLATGAWPSHPRYNER
jgi:hypothetical protein